MSDTIKDGKGRGYLAGVDINNRLLTTSRTSQIQHSISHNEKQAYQVIGLASLASGSVVGLHIKNSSAVRDLVITYIRHQIISSGGGGTFPDINNYFKISLGREYDSGGAEAIPVNLYRGSGNNAEVVVYQNNPTLVNTAHEIDRWYTKEDGDMNLFEKEGSVIVAPNNTLELSYVGDQTSGSLYTRLSFLMVDQI